MFTIIPAQVSDGDVEELSRRFHLIVPIGALYGLLAGVLMLVGHDHLRTIALAAVTIAALHLLNRFLHMDGLSDFGDGMVCGGTAERRMAAMKDSKTGAGGVGYALVFTLLSFAALASISGRAELFLLPMIAEVMNKNAMVICAFGGEAREGLGNAFVRNTAGGQALASLVLAASLALGSGLLAQILIGHLSAVDVISYTLAGLVTSIAVGLLMARTAMGNFGAVNGDVLGATNEICRPLTLIAMMLVVTL